MDIAQLIILSVTQGLTEFLPISSSAHLILVSQAFDWEDQDIVIDTTAHLGSLFAFILFVYSDKFRREKDTVFFLSRTKFLDVFLIKKIFLATFPAVILGFLLRDVIVEHLRNPEIISFATIIFAIVLFVADRKRGVRRLGDLSYKDAFLVGLAQSIALIPGVSRAGATLAAALFLGYSRIESLKFAVLLSVPVIILASFSEFGAFWMRESTFEFFDLFFVFIGSMISAYFCLMLLFKFIGRIGLLPFVVYRLILGSLILIFFI